jgi:hypothetical protein
MPAMTEMTGPRCLEQLVLYQCLFELLWRDSQNNNVVVLKSFEAGTEPETISGIFGATLGINLDNTKTVGTLHLLTKAVKNGPPHMPCAQHMYRSHKQSFMYE